MKTFEFSYFIERYNAGEMSESEKNWFVKELDGNEELRNEVRLRKLTDEVLEKQDIISLRAKLSAIEKKREADRLVIKRLKPVYYKYAAAIAGLMLIGSLVINNGSNLSSDEIINLYYKVYEIPTQARSAESATNADFTHALEYYNSQQYGKAAVFFNKVLESNPKDMQSMLLVGISNFSERRYPEAKQSFVRVIDDNNSYYVEAANWYLALCYVKTDEKEKALKQLEMIKKEGGFYSSDARKIIRKFK
jgi:tetratricopeptide (TPR) repeat protein